MPGATDLILVLLACSEVIAKREEIDSDEDTD